MQQILWDDGIVLRSEASGDYDKRVVLLTREHGRVTAFAKGARRQTNHLMAGTDLFAFGKFKFYPGRSAYSILDANISNYFEELRKDYDAALYGMYFLEVMEAHTREENDEAEALALLYQCLRALTHPEYDRRLLRAILELKLIMLSGEFNRGAYDTGYLPGTVYTLDYMLATPARKLFGFSLKEDVLNELVRIAGREMAVFHGGYPFKSLKMLETMAVS